MLKGSWNIEKLCNGSSPVDVAITPGCTLVSPWAAVVGGLSGIFYYLVSILLLKLEIDDPVDATPVHCSNGLWGTLSVGLFADKDAVARAYGQSEHYGAFLGGGGVLFGVQLLGVTICILWAAFWAFGFFYIVNYVGYLRVTPEIEKMGMDLEHVEMT